MDRYEFAFEATAELGDQAALCVIQRRGRWLLPVALVALPIVLLLLASEPSMHAAAALLGGAAVMLLLLFLIAMQYRRRVRRRWFQLAGDRTVHVVMDDAGLTIRTALGESRLVWDAIHRVIRNERVALLLYQGWTYVAFPTASVPPGAIAQVEARIAGRAAPRAS